MTEAIACKYRDGALHPEPRFHNVVRSTFVEGPVYWVNVEAERSEQTHKHEFAFVRNAWRQIPDELAESYPTPDHLRRRALIQAGYFDEQVIDAGSNAAAIRVATGVRSFPGESFSMVFVRGPYCIIRRAQSQSYKAMGAKAFHESKQAILQVIADMIGVPPEVLAKQREAA